MATNQPVRLLGPGTQSVLNFSRRTLIKMGVVVAAGAAYVWIPERREGYPTRILGVPIETYEQLKTPRNITELEARPTVATQRSILYQQVKGTVLEVRPKPGVSIPSHMTNPNVTSLTLVSDDDEALAAIKEEVEALGQQSAIPFPVELHKSAMHQIPFNTTHFDSVLASLAICVRGWPLEPLREMMRVCKGKVYMVDYGSSYYNWVQRLERFLGIRPMLSGCSSHPLNNRDPMALVKRAGLHIQTMEVPEWGHLYVITGRPDLRRRLPMEEAESFDKIRPEAEPYYKYVPALRGV